MEFSPVFTKKLGTPLVTAKLEFGRLMEAGFRAFLLFVAIIKPVPWEDGYLEAMGVESVPTDPLLGQPTVTNMTTNTLLWRVIDWNLLFAKGGACSIACNLWFTRY